MTRLLLFAGLAVTLASCSLQKQTTNTAKTLGIYGAGVIQKPVLTNLKVNPKKITSFYSGNGTQGVDYHKSQAIAKAMAENNAHVIVEPAYEIVSNTTSVQITTTGYAATYENFRQIMPDDTELLNDVGIIDYNKSADQAPPHVLPKKKKKTAGVLLGLLLIGLAGAYGGNAL